MKGINVCVIGGHLTRDPDLRYTPAGIAHCKFTIAAERSFTKQGEEKKTDFVDVSAWRATAEACANWLQKGGRVLVKGRFESREYEAADGQKKKVWELQADDVTFIDMKDAKDAPRSPKPPESLGDDDVPF